jgi:hypothetical protein
MPTTVKSACSVAQSFILWNMISCILDVNATQIQQMKQANTLRSHDVM